MKEHKAKLIENQTLSLPTDLKDREESIVATLSPEEANRFLEDKTHLQLLCDQKDHPTDVSLERLLKDAMNIIFSVVQSERGYILLYDLSGELKPRLIQRRHSEGDGNGASVSQTIIRKVLDEKTAVLSLDARTDPRFSKSESVQMHSIRSIMCVPLIHQEKILGILHVDRKLSEKAFTQTDLVLVTSVANLLAVALANRPS